MEEGKLAAFVHPTLFPQGEPEAAVPANYNLITLIGSASGRMSFYGQGAGRYPTAYNVVQDCADVLLGKGFYSPYGGKVSADNSIERAFYVRGSKDPWLESIRQENWKDAIVTKPVSVAQMHNWLKEHPGTFIAALPTE
jgi:hypothetical protein